jgi:RNA polymerase sigma-70 factor (ECF subfamily)
MAYRRDVLRDRHVLSEELTERIATVAQRVAAEAGGPGDAVRSCVDKLPPDKRQMVKDRYIASESVEQISKKLGKSVAAVSKMLFRIRRALLECVMRESRKEQRA